MEKRWRLERYGRKDYTEMVGFPVEIVGRDGTVRRHGFEESVRLYRRRILYAPVRYHDPDLVHAEVAHCKARIDQLRRSYFYRYGWGTEDGKPDPTTLMGPLAGELAAFLSRVLRTRQRLTLELDLLSKRDALPSTWYLRLGGFGLLLYLFPMEGRRAETAREAFFEQLQALERMGRNGGDAEQLIGFHHASDCGFILAGASDAVEGVAHWQSSQDPPTEHDDAQWEEVLTAIRGGFFGRALQGCQDRVQQQPWHRPAYQVGSALALQLDQPEEASVLAGMGLYHHPADPTLLVHRGRAWLALGRTSEGWNDLHRALEHAPQLAAARLTLALDLARAKRFRQAWRVLRARPSSKRQDRRLERALARLERWLLWRAVVVGVGQAAAFTGLCVAALLGWLGLLPLLLGLLMAGAGMHTFQRQWLRLVEDQNDAEEVSRLLDRLRNETPPPEVAPH